MNKFEDIPLELLGSNNFPDLIITASTFEAQSLLLECEATLYDVLDKVFIEGSGMLRIATQSDDVIQVDIKLNDKWQEYAGRPQLTVVYRFRVDDDKNLFVDGANDEGDMFRLTAPLAELAWHYVEEGH